MSWWTEWKAISDRIQGLLKAGDFFAQIWRGQSKDTYGVLKKELIPHAREIFENIHQFRENYQSSLPPTALESLNRFIEKHKSTFRDDKIDVIEGLKSLFPALASFSSEFTFQLSDT